ncbi:MAG: molybdenum cofactor biosynthesis protein MoaE [Nitrososphaerota archaeon]|jgi:molybdopterin synthase catalytic subunit|nr:molybdenum cofactor biosynthesis protein MoaE [Nitrososphaerota archaeon]MDG6932873.1 molybdenum cofactor biosynthesis protein MoaE [Nitrososphaerota archaeon]MDG6936288.1 molybdenum cofactor biosynthesis protein MoaE [Nitrososphaerota archaeon]MDG6944918.1 molybdenum cofactor biosynthesis protein MoaE [Nitrososphaerota archaeon]
MNNLPDTGIYKKGSIDLYDTLKAALAAESGESGIVLSYFGITKRPGQVKKLVIEAYKEYADAALKRISSEVKVKNALNDCRIYHLEGEFEPGEPIVLIIISSRSRAEALTAMPEVVERYKKEPTIWKKEVYEDGTEKWIRE